MKFVIRPAIGRSDIRKFVKSEWNFYKGNKNWVPPVISETMTLLDKEKNPFYEHSEIQLFTAESDGEVLGRIAAITNDNHNKTHNDNVGFFGFFECIDDPEVAAELFATAEHWLREKGKDIIRGPVDPSQNDVCGTLVKGFDRPPLIMMPYNPEYYDELIKAAGLEKAKDLYAYHINSEQFSTEKLGRMQKIVRERYDITVRQVNFSDKQQFKKDVATLKHIYNQAWEPNWGFVKMTDEEFDFLVKDLKMLADPSLVPIIESKGEPASFALCMPDINQVLIHNRRGTTLGAAWHLLTKKKKINWLRIIAFGILPKFQKTGVDAVMYWEIGKRGPKLGIHDGEASWILEDNTMMNRGMTLTMNSELYKVYRMYEKKL